VNYQSIAFRQRHDVLPGGMPKWGTAPEVSHKRLHVPVAQKPRRAKHIERSDSRFHSHAPQASKEKTIDSIEAFLL
jgi:hypothetical protein